jgi:hypothetical protein
VNGKPGRFIEYQDVFVFVKNCLAKLSQQAFGGLQAVALFGFDV